MSNNQTDAGPAPPMVAPPQDYIVWLDDPRALSSALVGGKGSNLARLVRERFCVPPGFVMSAGAVGLQQRHLKARIEQTAATYSGSSAISDRIQQMVIEEPVDPELSEAFRNAYRELMIRCGRETMVAVRSSAIAEDLPGASFAGQHDTFLGMRGEEEVLKAVVKCLASAWSARALEYRARMGVEEAVPAFAIIVQQQVDAEVSGVMFTVNPIDSSTEELVITASYGLGEAIVSGAVTPDTFIIEKAGRIRNRTLGAKQSMTPPTGSGSTTVPQQLRSQYALADQDVLSLAKLGVKIERTFGSPQDIEWSITGAKTYVLQSRPITAWRLREDLDQSGSRLSFAQRVFLERSPMLPNFTDHFPDPLTALDFTTIVRSVWFGIASTLTWLGFRVRSIDEILPATEDGSIRLVPGPPRPRLRVLAMPFRLYQALRLDAEKEWLMEDLPFIEALERSLPKLDLPSAPALDLVRALVQMQGFLEVVCVRRFRKYFVAGLLYGAMLRLLVRTVEESAEVSETMQALHSGIAHNASLMNRDVADLVQFAAGQSDLRKLMEGSPEAVWADLKSNPEASELHERFRQFLEHHGSRRASGMGPVLSIPTWAEKPEIVVGLVQTLLRSSAQHVCDDDSPYLAAKSRIAQLLDRGWKKWLGLSGLFLKSLQQSRQFLWVREESLHEGETQIAYARNMALEIGRRLAGKGMLQQSEDVFHLRIEEIEPLLTGEAPLAVVRARLHVRKQQHQLWVMAARSGRSWARIALGLPQLRVPTVSSGSKILSGLAASSGSALGLACVVHGQDEFHKLGSGQVLVCQATSPAWTPLFSLAAAVVTDIGGPLSHAAIVAREYGIPAVLGTEFATLLIRDGQTVLVDGKAGRVELRDDCEASSRHTEPVSSSLLHRA